MGGASYEWSTTVDGLSTESREKILAIVVSTRRFVSLDRQLEAAVSRWRLSAQELLACWFLSAMLQSISLWVRGGVSSAVGICGEGGLKLVGCAGCEAKRICRGGGQRVAYSMDNRRRQPREYSRASGERAKKTKLAWRFRELRYKRADQNGRERENVRKAGQRSYENESGNSA